ncbi:spore cortex biosynthesis protein YabQ [Mechercharimyces sp. CAU 1602]|uniref:spore cortex biosynthesis protein YabQ n=1 Tax=Mechercharimyces sp. CAU 1602 TaxID=2973933 RepID=UPI00216276DA|nr:spore cortex biosynthesis protein YabQ [Mechercharimyces sp. CAU 1602]MCS1352388.1 spore cortex biosynthesis protein YabQ [Mechercharimyces sp. CAU 1602]
MTLSTQWITLLCMIGSGWMMGVIWDGYRVLIHRFSLRGWTITVVDIMYWLVCVSLVFSLLFYSNWGQLRVYVFVAVIGGYTIYQYWFSATAFHVMKRTFAMIELIFYQFVRMLVMVIGGPIYWLWVLVVSLLSWLWRLARSIATIVWRLLSPLLRWMASPLAPLIRWLNRMARLAWGRVKRMRDWLFSKR